MLTIVSVLYITVHIISSTTQHSIRLLKFHGVPSLVKAPHESHVILLILVSLFLVAAFQALLFVLHDGAVALHGRVGYVVPALVHLVGAFIPVSVLIHGVQKDEDAQGGGRHYSDDHPGGAARFTDHFRGPWNSDARLCGDCCGYITEHWGGY